MTWGGLLCNTLGSNKLYVWRSLATDEGIIISYTRGIGKIQIPRMYGVRHVKKGNTITIRKEAVQGQLPPALHQKCQCWGRLNAGP